MIKNILQTPSKKDSKEIKNDLNLEFKELSLQDKKIYVLDTSVLLHDPNSINSFEDNIVLLPKEVMKELDKKKSESSFAGKNAREVTRNIESLIKERTIKTKNFKTSYNSSIKLDCISLKDNGFLIINFNLKDYFPKLWFKINEKDDSVETIEEIKKPRMSNDLSILTTTKSIGGILVSKDRMMRIIASVNNIKNEDYKKDKIKDAKSLYNGYKEIYCNKADINKLYQKKKIDLDHDNLKENNYYILKSYQNNPESSALVKYKNNKIRLIKEKTVHDIIPKNTEQTFVLDALMDKDIDLITLTGVAGTGKTLLALAAGLEQVVNKNDYRRLLVARPTVGIEDIGFLPGDVEQKLRPWMQPIYDNIDFIYQEAESVDKVIEEFKERNKLKIEPLAFIRGRSIPSQFFIIDEAQNLSPKQIKTIISRAGQNTKIVLTGDIEQIDSNYLNKYSNGLTYIIGKFKNENNYTHLNLKETERSRLAEQAAKLL